MKSALPLEPPEPVPAVSGVQMTDACYLPVPVAALFKSIICYLNIFLLKSGNFYC